MELKSGVVARNAPSLLGKARKNLFMAGTAMVAVVGLSGAAQAQCVASGAGGAIDANFLPASQGGGATVNSIVSVLNTVNTAFLTQSSAFVSAPGNARPDQQGGGVWTRGIGGTVEVDTRGTTNNLTVGGAGVGGEVTCDTTVRQNFGGFQVGADFARLNWAGSNANLHFGVTTGYAEANARDKSPGGAFTGNFEVPFAGLYAAFTAGNFFADAQVRYEAYTMRLDDPTNSLFRQKLDAEGVSFNGNFGYRIDLGNGYFIEPSAGIIVSRLDVDPLRLAGTQAAATGFGGSGTVQIDEIKSTLGRASLRFGTNFVANGVAWQPFLTASVFHEFEDDVRTRLFEDQAVVTAFFPGAGAVTADLFTSRIDTYGQFALGIAGQIINTGWLGYIRADYRIGEDIEGLSVNAGLRYQFTPEVLLAAAPMFSKGPVLKAPPAPIVLAYNWTGFYIGAQAGATAGQAEFTFVDFGTSVEPRTVGAVAGGQLGYNIQAGAWVFGVEVDGLYSSGNGGRSCPQGPNNYVAAGGSPADQFLFTCEADLNWLVTGTGRIGYAWDRLMFYVKGGVAAGESVGTIRFNLRDLDPLGFAPPPNFRFASQRETSVGYTVGGGFEFGLTQNWSAKAEYMFYDLGSDRFDIGVPVDIDRHGSLAKVGVNYRFGSVAGPVVARY